MSLLRQILSRWFGHGPHRILPFAALADHESRCLTEGVHTSECRSRVVGVEPDEPFHFPAAHSLLGSPPQFSAASATPQHYASLLAPGREKRLFLLADSAVIGCEGLVYSLRQRAAVAETAALWDAPATTNPLLHTLRFPASVRLPGLSLSLLARSSVNFFHFLAEALPRLHLARSLLSNVDHFIVSGFPDSYQARWLALAGVPVAKVVWAGPHAHYRCDQLLFTNDLLHDQQPTRWNVNAIRAVLGVSLPPSAPRRHLWISRRSASSRRIAWESQAIAELSGFETVMLEDLDPAHQIALFGEAATIVAPHGAGLANLAFCPPGARVVELFPAGFPLQPLYSRWAHAVGARPAWAAVDFDAPAAWQQLRPALQAFLA